MNIVGQVVSGTVFNMLFKHKNQVFKLTYDNRASKPLGFDSRFKAEIWRGNKWEIIAGKEKIRFEQICHSENHEEREKDADRFFDLMSSYIEKNNQY